MTDLAQRISKLSPKQREALLRRLGPNRDTAAPDAAAASEQEPIPGLPADRIPRLPADRDRFVLSSSQLRQWILDRLEPGTSAYNLPVAVRLAGPFDAPAFTAALEEIIRRHGSLRTTFLEAEGEPWQVVHDRLPRSADAAEGASVLPPTVLPRVSLTALETADAEGEVERLAEREAGRPFDLEAGPLFRAALVEIGAEEHVLLYTLHHIVSDGWSTGVLFGELSRLYEARKNGARKNEDADPLPELPIQYTDYAAWQRKRLDGEALGALLAYWRPRLAGAPPLVELPTDRPRPDTADPGGAAITAPLSPELTAALRRLGQDNAASLFMVLLAGYYSLLGRYSGTSDLPVGTFIANRNRSEVANLIGFFVNTLVLRGDTAGNPTFGELLSRVKDVTLGAFSHQDLPFERLLEEVQPERDTRHTPLFQHMLVLQNLPGRELQLQDLSVSYLGSEHRRAAFDLTFWVWDHGEVLTLVVNYRTDLFDDTTARRFLAHFRRLLAGAAAAPETRIGELPMLSPAEVHQVALAWQETGWQEPGWQEPRWALESKAPAGEPVTVPVTVLGWLARRAAETPDAPAVEDWAVEDWKDAEGDAPSRTLTYAELLAAAHRLGRRLRGLGVGPESVVGVAVDRSPEMIVALLGVQAAGGAYLPLDGRQPAERAAGLLADAGAAALVTHTPRRAELEEAAAERGELESLVVVDLDAEAESLAELPAEAPPALLDREGTAESAAYVIYTSGSTGRPKGVVVSNRALTTYARYAARDYGFRPGDRMLQMMSISFDASGEEIYPPLVSGGALVLRDDAMLSSMERFVAETGRRRLTAMSLPTAFWHELTAALEEEDLTFPDAVRLVILGGEKARREALPAWRRHSSPTTRLLNTYGPTEATIVTVKEWLDGAGEGAADLPHDIPLGRPIDGVRALVLDRRLRPAGVGVPGELCLGGTGVARGYLGRPERTAAAFVPDPTPGASEVPGARLYRTGDLARHRGDGRLEFHGRIDQQVKVRGFRVELGEIEARLARHPAVAEAAVDARPQGGAQEGASAPLALVAYVVPVRNEDGTEGVLDAELDIRALRDALAAELPDYMVPAYFVRMESLPRTASAKINRRALPDPEGRAPELERNYVAPRGPVEEVLAGIWSDMLNLERVGVTDSFFELGGHSLLATRLASRVRGAFDVELPLLDIFNTPTIEELAARIETADRAERSLTLPPLVRADRSGPLPVSFPQEQVWFLQQLVPDNLAYNFQLLVWMKGPLSVKLFEDTLTEIVRRHEIYSTTFPAVDGEPVQVIHEPWAVKTPVIDFGGFPRDQREDIGRSELRKWIQKPFDVERLPLVRWVLLRTAPDENAFLHNEHHFVHDGWSMGTFLQEMISIYEAFAAGEPSPLPELAIQYADWAAWQRGWMEGPVLDGYMNYWREKLEGAPPALALPTDRPHPRLNRLKGDLWGDVFQPDEYEEIRAFARREGMTLFTTLSAVFATVLARHSGQDDVLQGMAVANRRLKETEALIGMMVNTLVLRTRFAGEPTFRELLAQVRRTALEAYNYQDLPMDQLVAKLQPERDLSRNPLYQVMFSFHDAQVPIVEMAGVKAEMEGFHNRSAKTDLNVVALPRAEQHVGIGRSGREETLGITWEFNREIFDRSTIRRLIGHYRVLLMAAVADPERPVRDLPMLTAGERQQLAYEWNDTRRPEGTETVTGTAPGLLHVHRAVAAVAAAHPGRTAVEAGGESLTYGELTAEARALGGRLREALPGNRGTAPVVGLLAERSVEMVVGLLAVLEAGAAYLPLDPEYPAERLAYLLDDAGAELLLTPPDLLEKLGEETAGRLYGADGARAVVPLTLSGETGGEAGRGAGAGAAEVSDHDLAYVLYTSGSTGRPKGVMVPHGALASYVAWAVDAYGAGDGEGSLVHSPLTFDLTVTSLLVPLAAGGRVRLLPPDPGVGPLADAVAESRDLTLLKLTPTHLELLGREDGPLAGDLAGRTRTLVVGGEQLLAEHVAAWRREAPDTRVINEYGPTETVVGCMVEEVGDASAGPESRGAVSIGRPIADTRAHLLDRRGHLVPIGVSGEIHIGGRGVTRGYQGRPGATAASFVPDAIQEGADESSSGGARLYRTGDLARRLADGRAVYQGRTDHQVKVRGHRVELGEVEAALAGHPAVAEAAAAVREDAGGDLSLFAYLSPAAGVEEMPEASELREWLGAKLPAHMVPSGFRFLDALPLTANGKVDRRALAKLDDDSDSGAAPERVFVAPRSELESLLAELWAEVLGKERVGVTESFFDLGGHSLSATRVLARIEKRCGGVKLPLAAFFQAGTVERLAALVARRQEEKSAAGGEADDLLPAASADDDLSDDELDALLADLMDGSDP